jgi:hypothetical protein
MTAPPLRTEAQRIERLMWVLLLNLTSRAMCLQAYWSAAAPMENQAAAWYGWAAAWYGWAPKAANGYAWTGAWGNQMAAMNVQP